MDDDNPSTSMTSVHFHTHIVSHDECEEGSEGGEEERAAGNVAGGGDTGDSLGRGSSALVGRWSDPARTNSARIAARTGFSGRAYFYSRLPNHAGA